MMGWSVVNSSEDPADSLNPHVTYSPTCETAVQEAVMYGWGFSITYPRHRPFKKKWYSDNFKWAGPPIEREDEEDY
jgi:hypothetical protein